MKIQTSVRMSFTPSNHIGLSPFCTISATCLLFRRSPPLLTELGKDREPTVPTRKPAALRQMAGKASQPCSPNLFSQQTERAQNRKEGRELKAAAIWEPCSQRGRQPPAGALPAGGFVPTALLLCRGWEQEHGLPGGFRLQRYSRKEDML